jgi:hypothetical protein
LIFALKTGVLDVIQEKTRRKPLKLMKDVVTPWNSLEISEKFNLKKIQALKHREILGIFFLNEYETES